MDERSLKQIKVLIDESLKTALVPIKDTLSQHSDKLDTLLADVHDLQENQKANNDEFQDLHDLKKEMREIKEHLNL